jgi:hypothetical protein
VHAKTRMAAESGRASSTASGWGWDARDGRLKHDTQWLSWEAVPGLGPHAVPYGCGDTVALELDMGAGTLTAFKNGERVGLLAGRWREWMTGQQAFCWSAELFFGGDWVEISWCDR